MTVLVVFPASTARVAHNQRPNRRTIMRSYETVSKTGELDWDDLKIILAIARAESLTGASRLLYKDQSTISRRLNAVEATLGLVIFVRSKTGFRPTDAGAVVVRKAEEIERQASALVDLAQDEGNSVAGTVRIASNPWVISHLVMPQLPALLADYPKLHVHGIACTRERSLSLREVDLALWFEMRTHDTEMSVPICDVPYAVYAPQGVDPESLGWVSFWDGEANRDPMLWLRKHLPDGVSPLVTSTDAASVRSAIKAGVGKGLLPVCLGEEDASLICISTDQPELTRTLHAQVHPDMVQSARLRPVLRILRERLGKVGQ